MKTAADPFKVGSELNPKNVAGLQDLHLMKTLYSSLKE